MAAAAAWLGGSGLAPPTSGGPREAEDDPAAGGEAGGAGSGESTPAASHAACRVATRARSASTIRASSRRRSSSGAESEASAGGAGGGVIGPCAARFIAATVGVPPLLLLPLMLLPPCLLTTSVPALGAAPRARRLAASIWATAERVRRERSSQCSRQRRWIVIAASEASRRGVATAGSDDPTSIDVRVGTRAKPRLYGYRLAFLLSLLGSSRAGRVGQSRWWTRPRARMPWLLRHRRSRACC